jgi:hypothetical protein
MLESASLVVLLKPNFERSIPTGKLAEGMRVG